MTRCMLPDSSLLNSKSRYVNKFPQELQLYLLVSRLNFTHFICIWTGGRGRYILVLRIHIPKALSLTRTRVTLCCLTLNLRFLQTKKKFCLKSDSCPATSPKYSSSLYKCTVTNISLKVVQSRINSTLAKRARRACASAGNLHSSAPA